MIQLPQKAIHSFIGYVYTWQTQFYMVQFYERILNTILCA